MDQAKPENQDISRNERERGENSDLVRDDSLSAD